MTSKTTASSSLPLIRTTAIDVRDRYRPQRYGGEDIFEWFKNPQNVYCGRPNVYRKKVGAGQNIKYLCVPPKETCCFWKNPFKVGKDGSLEEVLEKFRDLLISEALMFLNTNKNTKKGSSSSKTPSAPRLLKIPSELCGKTLGCWCVGEHACHTQVLAFAANLCVEMNIRNENEMRSILEEEHNNKETTSAKRGERGFIRRLKEVNLMSLDAEYETIRIRYSKKKAIVKTVGGSSNVSTSKGTKRKVQSTIVTAAGSTAKRRLMDKLSGKKKKW